MGVRGSQSAQLVLVRWLILKVGVSEVRGLDPTSQKLSTGNEL